MAKENNNMETEIKVREENKEINKINKIVLQTDKLTKNLVV